MSRYVESWRIGDTAFWRGPFGSFLYEPNKVSPSVLRSFAGAESSLFQAIEVQCTLLPIHKPNTQSDVGLRQGREWIGPNKQNCPLYSRIVSESL